LVGDRRDVVVVEARAEEEGGVPGGRVARGEAAHQPPDLDLREGTRQVGRLAHLARDRGEERLDGGRPDRAQHLRAVGVGDREELHFSFSSSFRYSAYFSAVMSFSTSSSVESLILISQPSPYGSSLTMPGSATAPLLISTTSPETGVKSSDTA